MPAVAVAGLSLVPACLGPQLPWELGAGSIATSGGRRRESQLSGPAAPRQQQHGQVRLTDRAFPSQGPAAPDQHFQVSTPATCGPHLVSAINRAHQSLLEYLHSQWDLL